MRTLLLCLAALVAVPAAAAPKITIPELKFEKHTLPNGMQLILHVDKKLPIVHVNLWYHVGSKNERAGRTGFAHLFEHMMLQGSKNAAKDYFALLDRVGARPGRDSNGTTDNDRTNYFSTAPSGALEFMLWLHADLLATLPDALTQQKLDNQREVVRNERRQTYENTPYNRVWALQPEAFYPKGHPYSWPVIGFHEDLMAASLDDVKSFFRTYYTPNNLSLAITGDFDPKVAKALVEKYFGSIPPGPPLERPTRMPVRLEQRRQIDVADRVPQERLYLFWPAPETGGAGEVELDLATSILADGLSSRLERALVYDRKLCSSVDAGLDVREIAGEVYLMATARPGASLDEIEAVVAREIGRLARTGPTLAEVERARAQRLTAIVSQLQQIGGFGGKADVLNFFNVYAGDPARFRDQLARYQKVGAADIKRAAATWLDRPGRLAVRVRPESSAQPTTPEPDRKKEPALVADAPFRAPEVRSDRLANGLEVHVVHRPELPLVTAVLVSRGGSASDPPGKDGLAALTARMMKRGTKGKGALALEDAFADLGVALADDTQKEHAALILTALDANLPAALTLLGQVAREPSFPEAELERERKLTVDAIAQAEQDPTSLARRLRDPLAFGASHPYGHPVAGYRGTVSALRRDDLVAFHRSHWRPKNAALFVVGNLTLEQAKALAEKTLGTWSGEAPPPPAVAAAQPPHRGKVVIVDRRDAAQTYVVHILSAPAKRGDDYFAWRLASEVFGTGGSARLWLNLRQSKGYSYGVFAVTALYGGPLAWYALGGVQTDKTKESIVEFIAEAKGLAGARPITQAEADTAKQTFLRAHAAGFQTHGDVAVRMVDLWARRWPLSLLAEEAALLGRTTVAEAQAAARRYAVVGEATLLLVGDRAKIEAGVRSLKLGEVVILDVEGKPAKP